MCINWTVAAQNITPPRSRLKIRDQIKLDQYIKTELLCLIIEIQLSNNLKQVRIIFMQAFFLHMTVNQKKIIKKHGSMDQKTLIKQPCLIHDLRNI